VAETRRVNNAKFPTIGTTGSYNSPVSLIPL